jgi:hypothetical protein
VRSLYQVIKIISGVVLSILFIVGVLFYYQINNKDCLNISDNESRGMINRILTQKNLQWPNQPILFGYQLDDIQFGSFGYAQKSDDYSLGSVDLIYQSRKTGNKLFRAIIYDNCEVQWIHISNT